MSEIVLKLTIEKLNVVMAALGRMPYETVFQLINELGQQVQPQMQQQQPAGASEADEFRPRTADTPPVVPGLPNRPL